MIRPKRNIRRTLSGALLAVVLAALAAVGARAALLTFVNAYFDGAGGGNDLNQPINLAVSPDGKFVYVAALSDNAVSVFSRDSSTGELTYVESQVDGVGGVDGLSGAADVALSPDGSNVYVGGHGDDAVAVFDRDSGTGALTFVEMQQDGVGGVDGLNGVLGVAVSPDGKNVYAAGQTDDAVAVFSRNPSTGTLTYVEMQQDGVGGVDGLEDATIVVVSPDGKSVYATGQIDDAVAVFSRDSGTGALTFVEFQRDGVGGVDGLTNAFDVLVSLDGKNVYVSGQGENALAVFSRDSGTGALTFVEVQKDGVGGVSGIKVSLGLALSSDGEYLIAGGRTSNAFAIFSRDASTGQLTFLEEYTDGVDGVDGLGGAFGLALSPDDLHLYVAGSFDDAVAAFAFPTPQVAQTAQTASGQKLAKDIASSGTTSLQMGRIIVDVPSNAIPSGESNCRVVIQTKGDSGDYGFSLDDTVWDVSIVCDSGELSILYAPITVCVAPEDGITSDKSLFHSHNGASFTTLAYSDARSGYVCGTTQMLSLFTLGEYALPETGFAPGVVTQLPTQPDSAAYSSTDLTLDIPELGLNMPIVGVPQGPNGWDVSWLGDSAGYLYGTAFPTLAGNTVLTAHVWNADNTPGPFARLDELHYGDHFSIRAWGQIYTYEVRGSELYSPASSGPLGHEDHDWVTLITCEDYDEFSGQYQYRRAVQAVLISVD